MIELEEDDLIDALYTSFISGYMQSLFYSVGHQEDLGRIDLPRINDGFLGICGDIMNSLQEEGDDKLKLLHFNPEEEMNVFK